MFCPKCGNQLPDGSAFCGKCGSQLAAPRPAAPAAAPAAPAGPLAGLPTAAGRSPLALAAAALAAVAVVASLLPWFQIHPEFTAASALVDQISSAIGSGVAASFAFQDAYSPWAFPSLAGTIGQIASIVDLAAGMAGQSSASVGAQAGLPDLSGIASSAGGALWACFLLWIASAVLLAAGALCSLRGSGRAPMVAGAAAAAVAFLVFTVFSSSAQLLGQGTAVPVVFLVAALGAAACSFLSASRA